MENIDNYTSWILASVATGFAALSTAVASLWKINETKNSRTIEEMKTEGNRRIEELKADVLECKEDRERIRNKADLTSDELAGMKVRVEFLEQYLDQCQVKPGGPHHS